MSCVLACIQKKFMIKRIEELFKEKNMNCKMINNDALINGILKKEKIDLVLIELCFDDEKCFELIKKLKRNYKVSIVVITNNNKKEYVVKSAVAGVSDYIIMPFKNNDLYERIKICLEDKKKNDSTDIDNKKVDFEFKDYLNVEIKKSNKWKYKIAVILSTVDKLITSIDYERIYKEICKSIWDTDVYLKFNSQNYIGIFPLTNDDDYTILLKKLDREFDRIISEKCDIKYNVKNTCVVYPKDGESSNEILNKLLCSNIKK